MTAVHRHDGNHTIRFLLNGEAVTVTDIDPTQSVLNLLRQRLRCTGAKEGCAEGDCGACTVVLGELTAEGQRLVLKTINACIQFVPTLDGKALFTVEGLRQTGGALHPVQQAMVACHGSQCGFCTPGFVMSLWQLYNEHSPTNSRPTEHALRSALTGNLCRCTGYRPILAAGRQMFELPAVELERADLRRQLLALQRRQTLVYRYGGATFFAPRSLDELLALRTEYPQATLLAGCTDIGLWVNKQLRELGDIIYLGEVVELKQVDKNPLRLRIGASVTLTEAYRALLKLYPEVQELYERFASAPIRNAGTLGGNIANGSPIGDSMPWLIAVGAQVVLASSRGRHTLPLDGFYLGYRQQALAPDEVIVAIELPLPSPRLRLRTYKLSRRYDCDISALCAAFALELREGRITSARVAFGGMAAVPKRALRCEQVLKGQPWSEATVKAAMAALADDFTPLSDQRASADHRRRSAQRLLYRYFLETRPENPLPAASLRVFAASPEADYDPAYP